MISRIKSFLTWGGLLFLVALAFSSGTQWGLIFVGAVVGFMVLILLFGKRENLTKNYAKLLVAALLAVFVSSFYSAVQLGRPITHTDSFFKYAEVDFERQKLAYTETGEAMFKIGIKTDQFEKLVDFYRPIAEESQRKNDQYAWSYFELEAASIDRDIFFGSNDSQDAKSFSSQLQKLETTDSDQVDSYRLKSGIKKLMEGFAEFDDDLGPCRAIIWHSDEVTREFFWFEKTQQGYINP